MSKNLALGKSVEILPFVPVDNSFKYTEYGSDALLTDGNIASVGGDGWRRFSDGVGREITVDLGQIYAVDGFDIGFLHDMDRHIICPENVEFYLSENGIDFYSVACVPSPYPAAFASVARARYNTNLPFFYRARYVKIVFSVDIAACCDEIRVYGDEYIGISSVPSGEIYVRKSKDSFAPRDSLDGVTDMALVRYGIIGNRSLAMSREAFLPYLAYIDNSGRPVDTMFDSVAFVPALTSPSGGAFWHCGKETVLSDWEYLLEELFASDKNLCALDDAVGDVKRALSLDENHKLKVYLAAPVPKISLTPFGDLNGDGIEDKLITTDDCVNAYVWFVDNVLRRFKGLDFKNISLDGFLWNSDTLSRIKREDETDFAKKCVSELHKRSLKCIFMPYIHACGSDKTDLVGFDCSVASAGFYLDECLQRDVCGSVGDYVAFCTNYGFGTEIELPNVLAYREHNADALRILDVCLSKLISCGAMTDTVHIYDQLCSNDTLVVCALSEYPEMRAVYDKLYRFIKGNLTATELCSKPAEAQPEIIQELIPEPLTEEEHIEASAPICEPERETELEPKPAAVQAKPPRKTEKKVSAVKRPDKKCSCHKKVALGAGIAAAIGALYIIKKLTDKK